MPLKKAITDAVTGETIIVDETPEDVADREARQAAAQAAIEAQAQADAERVTEADILNAKTFPDLQALLIRMLSQNRL